MTNSSDFAIKQILEGRSFLRKLGISQNLMKVVLSPIALTALQTTSRVCVPGLRVFGMPIEITDSDGWHVAVEPIEP